VARFNSRSVQRLLTDPGIVRHRAKVEATINNARRYIELLEEVGSLAGYVWSFEPEPAARPDKVDWESLVRNPSSKEASALSKDLRRRGWAFVGPTTMYSFMEAVGIVNDHLSACSVRDEVERARSSFERPAVR
jgi:DNA-3-methyladenine glycosylase I